MIKDIPKIPNNKETKVELQAMSMGSLFIAYFTWRQRFIPAKPRIVKLWGSDAEKLQFKLLDYKLRPLFKKALAGDDITAHLSNNIYKIGYKSEKLKKDASNKIWEEKDFMLTAYGFYHFHLGVPTIENPTGRSNDLILAEVTDKDFTVISLTNHQVFDSSSEARRRFYESSTSYIERNMLPNVVYLRNPISTSGHSTQIVMLSSLCAKILYEVDGKLDNADYTRMLFEKSGRRTPQRPKYRWAFSDMNLCIVEEESRTFFIMNKWQR